MVNVNKKMTIGRKGEYAFQIGLLAWPIVQFIIFYIVVNLNSFKLAFSGADGFTVEHFKYIFSENMFPQVLQALGTSMVFYVVTTVVSIPLGLLFAYYIYKKGFGGKLFRFFLFLPSILSAMVMVVLFTGFMDIAAADILHDWFGADTEGKAILNMTQKSSYGAIIFFNLWVNFGTTTLIYSNKMGELSPEMIEAAELDGANHFQEFFHVVLPFTFPTISVFLVTGLATIFANQYNLFSFYGGSIGFDAGTMGYFIFNLVQAPAAAGLWDAVDFNRASAISIMITMIVVPITLTARWALDKYGPQD